MEKPNPEFIETVTTEEKIEVVKTSKLMGCLKILGCATVGAAIGYGVSRVASSMTSGVSAPGESEAVEAIADAVGALFA